MTLHDLHVGDTVWIKLPHWVTKQKAIVVDHGTQHCQLHGDYIGDTLVFRKVKKNGKISVRYELLLDTKVEMLKVIE